MRQISVDSSPGMASVSSPNRVFALFLRSFLKNNCYLIPKGGFLCPHLWVRTHRDLVLVAPFFLVACFKGTRSMAFLLSRPGLPGVGYPSKEGWGPSKNLQPQRQPSSIASFLMHFHVTPPTPQPGTDAGRGRKWFQMQNSKDERGGLALSCPDFKHI